MAAAREKANADIRADEIHDMEERDKIDQETWKRKQANDKLNRDLILDSFQHLREGLEELDLAGLRQFEENLKEQLKASPGRPR